MEAPANDLYRLTNEREVKMWNEAIFIFDSSALLDFYFLPYETRSKVFNLFGTTLKGRLWIPSHVQFEYGKNREKVIKKPITENYKPLKDENLKAVKNSIKEIETRTEDLKNRTRKDDKHPFVPQDELNDFSEKIEVFKKEFDDFENSFLKRLSDIEEEINKLPSHDDVSEAVSNLFKVGRYYTFTEVLEITKEGKHRYEYLIPPGYEDLKDKEKKGTQIFGDLIIWKQILEFASEAQKPIIFICDDLKEDWCYLEKSSEKRIESPREELIKEIYDIAKVDFWMYNQPQFLYKSNEYFKADIDKQKIDNLTKHLSKTSEPKKELIFECDKCGHKTKYVENELDLDFDCIESSERGMGAENRYDATEYLECEECGNEVNVTFSVWEYPVGIHNYDDIEIDGATLISCFSFSVDFFGEPEPERCQLCGDEFKDDRHIGVCNKCDENYGTK